MTTILSGAVKNLSKRVQMDRRGSVLDGVGKRGTDDPRRGSILGRNYGLRKDRSA